MTAAGVAGRMTGDVSIGSGFGVQFSGNLTLAMNTSHNPVNESFDVFGVTTTINLPAGKYLRFEGVGMQLRVAGQTVTGDFAFEQAQSTAQRRRQKCGSRRTTCQ